MSLMACIAIFVVKTLRNQDTVRDTEVNGNGNYDRHQSGPSSSDQIGHVADEPYKEKGKRDGLRASIAIILN